jgi:hypothetical protein
MTTDTILVNNTFHVQRIRKVCIGKVTIRALFFVFFAALKIKHSGQEEDEGSEGDVFQFHIYVLVF